jgi:hypothetical protein
VACGGGAGERGLRLAGWLGCVAIGGSAGESGSRGGGSKGGGWVRREESKGTRGERGEEGLWEEGMGLGLGLDAALYTKETR